MRLGRSQQSRSFSDRVYVVVVAAMNRAVFTELDEYSVHVFLGHLVPHHHKNVILGNEAGVLVHFLHYCEDHLFEISALLSNTS